MTFITVREASEKWNITERRICVLCSTGRIPGAVKKSKVWMIPSNATKPEDGRKKEVAIETEPAFLFLNPTYFEENNLPVANEEAKIICDIQLSYAKGNLDEAYGEACSFIGTHGNSRYLMIARLIKAVIESDMGKMKNVALSLSELDAFINNGNDNIEALLYKYYRGYTDGISIDLLNEEIYSGIMPLIGFYTAKRKLTELIEGGRILDIAYLEIVCKEVESKNSPLISAYYHIIMAVFYNLINNVQMYEYHIRIATNILLPRGWYTPLAEYSATINLDFIREIDPQAYLKIRDLSRLIISNYINIGVFEDVSNINVMDTSVNIKVGYMILKGKSNDEIAVELGISKYKVRQHIEDLCSMAGASSRKEIKSWIVKNLRM